MKSVVFFLFFLLPLTFSFVPATPLEDCNCPGVSNVQGSVSGRDATIVWDGPSEATEYKVWYKVGNYTSSPSYTGGEAYTYPSLSTGAYTFYVQTICGEEPSGYIGNVDAVIQ